MASTLQKVSTLKPFVNEVPCTPIFNKYPENLSKHTMIENPHFIVSQLFANNWIIKCEIIL